MNYFCDLIDLSVISYVSIILESLVLIILLSANFLDVNLIFKKFFICSYFDICLSGGLFAFTNLIRWHL